jgi:hypothetical protein
MARKRVPTLATFSPKMIEVWREASTKKITILVDNHKTAIALRHRLYSCRAAMKQEDHPDYNMAQFVSIYIRHEGNSFSLVAERGDANLDSLSEILLTPADAQPQTLKKEPSE